MPSGLQKEQLLDAYKLMTLLRRFEEKAATLYQQGEIRGFCHLYIGQEAVLAACKAASVKGDDFITSYRCHAHAVANGVDPKTVMAELTGREAGVSKGKGGSMHIFAPKNRVWGGHGIVAAQVPIGTGLAFAAKYKGEKRVSLTFMGDGAANQGQVFESFNMAALWQLPVLYIIENNRYGMGTAASRIAAGDLYKRGEPFGIKGQKVDGQDFFAVYDAVNKALADIRAGKGPQIIEMDTYRYKGHSMSDPAQYRTRDEVEGIKNDRDPIKNFGARLVKEFAVKETDLKEIDTEAKAQVKEIVDFALNAPLPDESELYTDIIPE